MKGIKARAWDGKKMVQCDAVFFKGCYSSPHNEFEETIGCEIGPGDHGEREIQEVYTEKDLMFSTGLKDKSGIEIYEGDIIAHEKIIKPGADVQWDNSAGSWSIGAGWPFSEFYEDISKVEIVGHIHEK